MKRSLKILLILSVSGLLLYAQEATKGEKNIACQCAKENVSRTSILKGDILPLHLSISGMSCEGCSAGLSAKLSSLDGVEVERISHQSASVKLKYKSGEVSLNEVIATITKAGFLVEGRIHTLKMNGINSSEEQKKLHTLIKEMEGVLAVQKIPNQLGHFHVTTGVMSCSPTISKKVSFALKNTAAL